MPVNPLFEITSRSVAPVIQTYPSSWSHRHLILGCKHSCTSLACLYRLQVGDSCGFERCIRWCPCTLHRCQCTLAHIDSQTTPVCLYRRRWDRTANWHVSTRRCHGNCRCRCRRSQCHNHRSEIRTCWHSGPGSRMHLLCERMSNGHRMMRHICLSCEYEPAKESMQR